jgi:hypothetical protein
MADRSSVTDVARRYPFRLPQRYSCPRHSSRTSSVGREYLVDKRPGSGYLPSGDEFFQEGPRMVEIERSPGQVVRIGPYTLRVVAVLPDRVVIALRGPGVDEPHQQEIVVPHECLAWTTSEESGPAGRLLA